MHLATTVEVLSHLRELGHDVLLVSSGAVGAGCQSIGLAERPSSLVARQALAAIGQVHLMGKYDLLFSSMGQRCAQVLLTYENFVDRVQFLNARNTFDELFRVGAVPIVNENDSVGIQELKADNDKLAGMVGNMIGADVVFLMTDVGGVYTANPHTDPDAQRIDFVDDFEALRARCKLGSGEDSEWGTGGMAAKIAAAALATSLGVRTVIMHADDCQKIEGYVAAEQRHRRAPASVAPAERYAFGTTFERSAAPPRERKRWIRSLHRRGAVVVDAGARRAVVRHDTLFAVGITRVTGEFTSTESVAIVDEDGRDVAVGLSNFSSTELRQIKGMQSDAVFELVGQSGAVIERENMDVFGATAAPQPSEKPSEKPAATSETPALSEATTTTTTRAVAAAINAARKDSMSSNTSSASRDTNPSFMPPSKGPFAST